MRALLQRALLCVLFGSLFFSQALLAAACPTSADIPANISAARHVLESLTPEEDRSLAPEGALIKGLVDFIVARGKAEVRVWFLRSVVNTLCTKDHLKDYFSSTCLVYSSPLFKQPGGLSETDFNALVRDIKTDATYAPACALHDKLGTLLTDGQIAQLIKDLAINGSPSASDVAQYKEGIASIGYYYTAVALKATTPIQGSNSLVTIAGGAGAILLQVKKQSLSLPLSEGAVLDAWKGVAAAAKGDYAVAFAQISLFLSDSNSAVPDRVSTALRTAIAIATAKDEQDVASVLDSVASPVGSWAVKQSRSDQGAATFVTSITALPGVQVGYDKIKDIPGGVSTNSYGLFLPIGVQFSRAQFGGALSLLLSPLDAGAVVSYANKKSTSSGTVQSTSPVTWRSIVAPGAYATYSFHNSPFVIGVGYQRSPSLRSIELSDKTTQTVTANRVLLLFAVDVTVFMYAR